MSRRELQQFSQQCLDRLIRNPSDSSQGVAFVYTSIGGDHYGDPAFRRKLHHCEIVGIAASVRQQHTSRPRSSPDTPSQGVALTYHIAVQTLPRFRFQ